MRVRAADGHWSDVQHWLQPFDSMLSEFADPVRAPELLLLRDRMRSWRFYAQLRTDAEAPARTVQVGTRTPALASDGRDLAAAVQTIREIGDAKALDAAIDQGFPGCRIEIHDLDGRFELSLRQPGMLRPLTAAELSDGTLRYLLLVAALLTPRPPELIVLNEPETSLHPDLIPALANLMSRVVARTQLVVVSHPRPLLSAIEASTEANDTGLKTIRLIRQLGETKVEGQGALDEPAWHWPKR